MKIILALIGLVILLPRRSGASFLRHVDEAEGRMLQSCQADCEYGMCTVEGEAECLREAEESADQKWAWCISLDGKYGKWKDGTCGSMLKKPAMEYDCGSFEICVQDHHCLEYPSGRCGITEARNKSRWAKTKCNDGEYGQADSWKTYCPLKNYAKVVSKQEINCPMFSSCVRTNHCNEYSTAGCDDTESDAKAIWALNTCKANPAKANQWKKSCPIENYPMDPVCDAFRGCMVKVMYNNNIAKKLDSKVSMCISDRRFESQCDDNCYANCPCDEEDMTDCAEKYDECRAHENSKKCFKKAQNKSYKDCCCLDKNCQDSAQGHEECGFLMKYNNRAGSESDDDPPLPIDYCSPDPCKNNGMCISNNDAKKFECKCAKGYEGKQCEQEIDYCESAPCVNGGTCQNDLSMKDGYKCSCPDGYAGKKCEISLGPTIEYRYVCDFNTACRCYDSDCAHRRGTYDTYEGVSRGECERMCNENGRCNG